MSVFENIAPSGAGHQANGMTIIKADVRHVDLIVPLFDQYRQFYGQKSDPVGARGFLFFRMSRGESVVFLAVNEQGDALGFSQLYPSFSSISMKKLWILNDLFVLPKARGLGLAKALMARAIQLSKETGAEGLFLQTANENLPAQALYEKFGFVRDEVFLTYTLVTF